MSVWKNLRGTLETIFGVGTINVKDNAGVGEVRNEADSALAKLSIGEPTTTSNAATKNYVDTQIAAVNPDSAGTLKENRFTIDITAAQESTLDVPANARVRDAWLEVTSVYDAGTTIKIGTAVAADAFQTLSQNKPTVLGTYSVEQDVAFGGSAGKVKVAVGGSPLAGAGVVIVRYSIA